MSATDAQEEREAVLLAELADALAPLAGAVEVAHPLAGGDQIAAGPARTEKDPCLAGESDSGRLVEPGASPRRALHR
jgi:hypothetical protein